MVAVGASSGSCGCEAVAVVEVRRGAVVDDCWNPMWGDSCGRVEVRRGASGQLPEPNVGRCRGRVEVRRGASGQLPEPNVGRCRGRVEVRRGASGQLTLQRKCACT